MRIFLQNLFYLRSLDSLQSEIWQLWSLFAPLNLLNRGNFSKISFSTCFKIDDLISGTLLIEFLFLFFFCLFMYSIYRLIWLWGHAVYSWFTLFWRNICFVAIYSLLCGAEMNSTVLSVEEKEREQICCLWIWPDSNRFDLAGVKIRKSSFWGCSPGGGAFNW